MSYIYSHTDPAKILKAYVRTLPEGQKRGVLNRIARASGMFPSYLSQILRGDRHLNQDQAILIAEFMLLNEHETKYFLRTTEFAKAQSRKLKEHILGEMNAIRSTHHQIQSYVNHDPTDLTELDQNRFYSSWVYTAVRILTALNDYKTTAAIAQRTGFHERDVREIVDFLQRTGLCVSGPDGLGVGPSHTHLSDRSPFVIQHHANWRRKAMDRHPFLNSESEIAYSGALTLSTTDVLRVRDMVIDFVQRVRSISDPSPAQRAFFLNVDWLEL